MTDLENLPEPEVLAEEIIKNLRSALASFEAVWRGCGQRA
jgi:type I restriction enzyme M protein